MSEAVNPPNSQESWDLTILATSDLHSAMLDFDYFSDRVASAGSLARIATLIKFARERSPDCLLVDNGDFLLGTPLADAHLPARHSPVNPVVLAMNHLKYDAVGLGNHEFNLRHEDLRTILEQIDCPVLCSNLDALPFAEQPYAGLWRRSVIINARLVSDEKRTKTVKVGLFSVLPPQVIKWDAKRIGAYLAAQDIVAVSEQAARELKEEGADIVLALAHSGFSSVNHVRGSENAALSVARLSTVDAVVAGHVHKVFPLPDCNQSSISSEILCLAETPIVMPGAFGSHLGFLRLSLRQIENQWQVTGKHSKVIPSERVKEDPSLVALLSKAHKHTLAAANVIVGDLEDAVHSYFSVVLDDRAVRLVAEAKLDHLEREFAGTELASLPLLASVAPMKCGGRGGPGHYTDIAAGPMPARAIADLQLFANELSVLRLTGAEILEWLEMSSSLYNQLIPGTQDQILIDQDTAAYNREAIYGLAYEINLSAPARYGRDGLLLDNTARRVESVTYRGLDIDLNQEFLLATNEYRAGGGGGYPGADSSRSIDIRPAGVREILCEYLASSQGKSNGAIPSWRFKELPSTSAIFDTGTRAELLQSPDCVDLKLLEKRSDGFCRFRLKWH
ncbi:5'-nucleotidase C-terminal domain-containing protein [Shimia abyssi]|uniref:2',3'-cyclic-nucleotide 2'-phosphodiesterase/3'-nucleotidase n=1 Tax=Shimia abyssi TaxID=1662395 RepID=A0A2P8FKN5_9RHOB|nr:5'-nucleotidase C-terminal domain-containing protein [Shimia abyssi]PSL22258.1 2',3'-cyclic-nucleotide 2'-phosphodiesterase/3'-nucleotidase [Shimia abyssi]